MTTPEEMDYFLENVFEIDDDDIIAALFEQGLDTIHGYNNLELEDIPRVCNNIRKPGSANHKCNHMETSMYIYIPKLEIDLERRLQQQTLSHFWRRG